MKVLLFIIFAIVLVAASAAWGESLMDIKAEQLNRPVKYKWGKDPFLRFEDKNTQTGSGPDLPGFSVEGIMTDGRKALAIIDGGFYRKGDTLGGFVIEKITTDRVMLERDGKIFVLQVKGFAMHAPDMEAEQ